jgi:cellulose biosynthesis protein BcsQ
MIAAYADRTVVFLNEVPSSTTEGEEAADFLKQLGNLLPVTFGDRAAFRQALTNGRGVAEFAPKSAAAKEASNLYRTIKERTKL